MSKSQNVSYVKRERKRKLSRFAEYKSATFATGVTFGIFLILALTGFDIATMSYDTGALPLALVYLASSLVQGLVTFKIQSDIIKHGDIRSSTRLIGFAMLLFLLTANIFIGIAVVYHYRQAFLTRKLKLSAEYIFLCFFLCLCRAYTIF